MAREQLNRTEILDDVRDTSDDLADVKGAELLTPRERQVLRRVIAGASNKEAGRILGISPRTIEVHRAHIMDKLGAKNTADLVRIVMGQAARH
jgi:DNA-binding CsgD family transcriptional regulator